MKLIKYYIKIYIRNTSSSEIGISMNAILTPLFETPNQEICSKFLSFLSLLRPSSPRKRVCPQELSNGSFLFQNLSLGLEVGKCSTFHLTTPNHSPPSSLKSPRFKSHFQNHTMHNAHLSHYLIYLYPVNIFSTWLTATAFNSTPTAPWCLHFHKGD